jgi:hypothetical protein
MPSITQEFESAPMGASVVRASLLVIVLVSIVALVESGFAIQTYRRRASPVEKLWPAGVSAAVALTVIVLKFRCDRVATARFRIEDNVLVLAKKRYPLVGLTAIARDPLVMRWAFRIRGNGGLGAIRGRYWSKRLGKFDSFLTGTENAVLLTWPTNKVVVAPNDTEFFIHTVRKATDLRGDTT